MVSHSHIVSRRRMDAAEAAELIEHGEVIGASGFTPAGYPKDIPVALAAKARRIHAEGREFSITLYTGASTGDELDGELARAGAINRRMPYQSNKDLRNAINDGSVHFVDMHLSHMPQMLRYGFLPKVTTAIIEACDVTDDGKVFLTMSNGNSPTFLTTADRILIEYNQSCPAALKEMHDCYIPEAPPTRDTIPVYRPGIRVGTPYVQVDPAKIVGIVWTDKRDAGETLRDPGEVETRIAENVVDFLLTEQKKGHVPLNLPYQSGVGNVANAVLSCFATLPGLGRISMYTEVIQDSIFQLMDADRLDVASSCSLTLSAEGNDRFARDADLMKRKIVLRPQEISNNPGVVRRLGVIAMNTALEFDIFGNVNSTNVMGARMMNGIGGSADFSRNAFISVFMAPSIAKGGAISSVVPMVSHVDSNEHSVQVVITEQGVADLRGKSPIERARLIIQNCAHPDYRPLLQDYFDHGLKHAPAKHMHHTLDRAFSFHTRFLDTGTMKV